MGWMKAGGAVVFAVLLISGHAAHAADKPSDQIVPGPCGRETNDLAMAECMDTQIDRENRELSARYKAYLAQVDPGRQKALRKSQQVWTAFRDADCAFEGHGDILGALGHVVFDECYTERTQDRLRTLRKWASGEYLKH